MNCTGLLLVVATTAEQNRTSQIYYNVIASLNETIFKSMVVIVDNVIYPLEPNKTFPILFSGKAPSAQSSYQYAKLRINDNSTLVESFPRQPVNQNTLHEFFNRTWNTHNNAQLPQVYPYLDAIHRIKSDLHRDNEIPTIHISGKQTELDQMNRNISADISVQTNVSYISLHDAFLFEDVEVSLAGRSSRWMSKLSYNLKLKKKSDLYGYQRLKLRALGNDPSYIREQLAYDMVKSVGLVSSEFSYVRVIMNSQELGLFGILDTFKSNWLANMFADGDSSYKNGYLYQAVFSTPESSAFNHSSDLSYMDNITAYGEGQYKIEKEASDGEKDNWKPLQKLTKFIANAPTNASDAVKIWNKHLNTDSFLRSVALEVLVGYSDGYLSMADNYYLYQNPETGNYIYISSDMDYTFGFVIFKREDMWSGNYSTFPGMHSRPLMNQLMRVPEFKQKYEQLLQDINSKLLNPNITNARIDDIVDMIREDVAWDQSLPRVSSNLMASALAGGGGSSVINDAIGPMPANIDIPTAIDMVRRMNDTISFEVAVNGPTGHISLAGVKEWLNAVHQNTTQFFSQR